MAVDRGVGWCQPGLCRHQFLIVTAVSGVLILAAFLGLAFVSGSMDFSLQPIMAGELGMTAQLVLMGRC